jgi:SPP1 family phage portal protein
MARTLFGRREIKTSEAAITAENVVRVLSSAYTTHLANRDEIEYLYKYYKGYQPVLERVKEVRPEICNQIIENRSAQITNFLVGYTVGKPIQYVSTVSDDSTSADIARLNDLMRVAGKATKDKQLVEWMVICGLGYRMALPTEKKGSKVPFSLYTPDPRNAFIIKRNDIANTPLAGVYYITNENIEGETTDKQTFYVYTNTGEYFVVEGWQSGKIVEHSTYKLPYIPIIEYPLNYARLGAFEVVLSLLDALNDLQSNRLDSVAQFVQNLLVAYNCELPGGETANTIREKGIVTLKSNGENKADLKSINETLNQDQIETLKRDILDAINEIVGIPSQSNGSTGDSSNNGAVILKNGWQGAETRAQDFEMMFREPEQQMLGIVSDICNNLLNMNLDADNIDVKFTRRNYEDLLVKSQTLITMLGNDKIHPQCAYEASGLFIDTQDAYNMGMEWFKEHGETASVSAETEVSGNENPSDRRDKQPESKVSE